MHVVKVGVILAVAVLCICVEVFPQEQEITVTGKLIRVMAIGGESTGWAIQLESERSIDGKQVDTLEIASQEGGKLERLQNKLVKATGKLAYRNGIETGRRTILDVSSITEVSPKPGQTSALSPTPTPAFRLTGSEWLLEDLGGSGVIDNVQATLAFPEAGRVSGNSSCNRFFGSARVSGNALKLGPLGSTRRACPEAVMNQETKYLNALQAAERFEWKDPYLFLYRKGLEKPLRFTRKKAEKPAARK
jgi:heat shock protein HslJ